MGHHRKNHTKKNEDLQGPLPNKPCKELVNTLSEPRIRVKESIKIKLENTITQLKKHKRGRVTYTDAIESLYDENRDLKREKREWQAKQVLAESTEKEVVTLGEESSKDLIEQPIMGPSEHTTCPHHSIGDDVVLCSKDYDKKGTIHKIPDSICMQCWQRNKSILAPDIKPDTEQVECLCRYEHAGKYFCVKNPPRSVPLAHNLKTCLACPDRLTKDKAEQRGLIMRTHDFVTCKAKENMDPKLGLMLYCEREGGRWVTIAHCKKQGCENLKTVQTT